jgi:hypothetical protein
MDDLEPDFCEIVVAALDNAGIEPAKRLQAARNCVAVSMNAGPRLVEENEDEIIYEITLDLPDAGFGQNVIPPNVPASPMTSISLAMSNNNATTAARQNLSRSRRSVIGHQHQPKPITQH